MKSSAYTSTVFISYRRQDTQDFADRLYDALSGHLGSDRVFMDIDSIGYGEDFEVALQHKLDTCTAMLVLIGPGWLTVQDSEGHRRLDDPRDFVRLEVEAGLARSDVRVIPVLAHGTVMPATEELPPTLTPLAMRQALVLSREYFRPGVERLLEVLEPPKHGSGVHVTSPDVLSQARSFVGHVESAVEHLEETAKTQASGHLAGQPAQPLQEAPGTQQTAAKAATTVPSSSASFKTAITIVTLFFFFPIGLVLTWRYAEWSNRTKWIATGIVAGVVAIYLIVGSASR